jgi:hypothetical protein
MTSPDWRDIPVFIVNRNRLGALRLLVDWLCAAGTRRVVIMDNASDYPPLLRYYEQLPEGVKVMRLPENHGPYVLWEQGVHKLLETPYVVTDSDVVPADCCPKDLIGALLAALQRWPDAKKVGTALRIDNLPDGYIDADTVRKWESQFWEHPVAPGVFAAPVDTTFAIYPARGEFSNEACNLRLGHPYIAEHTPWYAEEVTLGEEERYYREHTSPVFSNWSVAKKDSWVRKSERVAGFERRAKVLHVDGGREYIPGWINAGSGEGRFDVGFDPRRCREQPLDLADDSLDGIHLSHMLEGVHDAQALFEELHRVAKPNARLFVRVLPGSRDDVWQDPSQRRAWHEGSFAFFAQPALPVDGCGYRGDWEVETIRLAGSPGSTPTLAEAPGAHGRGPELVVTLRAVKPARPRGGVRPVAQVKALPAGDGRVDPAFGIATGQFVAPAHVAPARTIRLGLPWRLQHYIPMNGPHPLVQSFVQGNASVDAIELEPSAAFTGKLQQAVVVRVTEQARLIPNEATPAFVEALYPQDQFVIEAQASRYDALFLHTTPTYAGSQPWLFHFESFPSLFMPFMYTGRTTGIDLTAQGFFKLVRANLESAKCLRIFSHMRGSLEILARTFDSPIISAKCRHVPLGIAPVEPRTALAKYEQPGLRILFTNSLHQDPTSFYLRGGHHLLEAFARLRERLPDITLTVLSSVPHDLLQRFAPEQLAGVNWIDKRVDDAMLERLYLHHHLFALPAAGLHSYSLLRAFAHGCVPIVSDAPGYEEYTQGIEDSVLRIRGVRALVYRDEPSGWISDQYTPFIARSESFVQQIHDQVLEHAGLTELRELARRNLEHCRLHFSLADSQAAFNQLLPGP